MQPTDYNRRCSNWLKSYEEYVMPRIAAPKSYVFWSGMHCLASAIRRKVYIGHNTLGSWSCYPHCYILLVGPPGFRKNTAMGPAIEILEEMAESDIITPSPSFITKESVIDGIMKSKDGSIYFDVEEFGDLFIKSGPDMFEVLTSLFDAKKKLSQQTMSRQFELAEKPCVNLLAGTTPQWIADKMPVSVIGGGLASRILFIYEDKEPNTKIFFKGGLPVFSKLRNDLVDDLAHIANNIEGEFLIAEEDQDWFENWNSKVKKKSSNPKLQGYEARKITYILKVAQLFHISYSDKLTLHRIDLETAIKFIESIERNLPKVFAGVGKNIYAVDSKDIYKFILENPNVTKDRLLREFESVGTVPQIDVVINGLVEMKLIVATYENELKQIIYKINKGVDIETSEGVEKKDGSVGT